jgi:hypothetical protein
MKNNKENSIPVVSFAIEGYVAAETRHWKSNELVQRVESKNIVLNWGLDNLAKFVAGVTEAVVSGVTIDPWAITRGVIGTNSTAASGTDYSITNPEFSGALAVNAANDGSNGLQYTSYATDSSLVRATWSYGTGDANGQTYTEVALARNNSTTFNNGSEPSTTGDNVLFSRATHGGIAKTTDVTLSYTYDLKFKTAS